MTLKITRNDNEVTIISNRETLVVVCCNMTASDHAEALHELALSLDKRPIDLYYKRNLVSVFIFDAETLRELDNKDIGELIPDIDHRTIYKGAIYGNSKLGALSATSYKEELKGSKKFDTLLTMRQE